MILEEKGKSKDIYRKILSFMLILSGVSQLIFPPVALVWVTPKAQPYSKWDGYIEGPKRFGPVYVLGESGTTMHITYIGKVSSPTELKEMGSFYLGNSVITLFELVIFLSIWIKLKRSHEPSIN